MERIAIIDLGSNSVRFVIMHIESDGAYKLVYQEKKGIRLSEGMTENHMSLTEAAQERALSCMRVYAHMASVHHITHMIAVATAAVRNAVNGNNFLSRVQQETGIPLKVITGKQEAELGYRGVVNTINETDFIMFDLGGASIEISLIKNRQRIESVSLPLGAVTVTEKFHSQETVSSDVKKSMRDYIKQYLRPLEWLKNQSLPIIGVGGTMRNLAKIHQKKFHYAIPKLHNYEISCTDLFDLCALICDKNYEERKKIPGLSSERADIIVAGVLIISELVRMINPSRLIVSGCGLREGLFFYYYGPSYMNGQNYPRDMLLFSVLNYRHTLPLDDDRHSRYVTSLAVSMFDQWKPMHHLLPRDRQLLTASGLLHDIGKLINYYNHAAHSAYMIANAHIFGLSHHEQIICALIAAFHHGYSGKMTRFISYYQVLNSEELTRVRRLSLFLSMAEALDETYEQCVKKLSCHVQETAADIEIELYSGNCDTARHSLEPLMSSFEKTFKKPLSITWKTDGTRLL
jgi:exopolyphosphatase/guanosine-5'-triphosphate,3'-diphosphate pyrophosphatase